MRATIGGHYLWPIHKLIPEHYYTEPITGLFISTPYILLAIIPFALLIKEKFAFGYPEGKDVSPTVPQWKRLEILMIVGSLTSVVISSFAPLLFFVDTSMRHLTDVIPILLILSTLGFWIGFDKFKIIDRGVGRSLSWFGGLRCILPLPASC